MMSFVQHFTQKANATAEKHEEKIVITPRTAVAMLQKANAESEIRPKRVEGLAQLTTAGNFPTCLPLKFENAGCIQDGAHRLHAIAQSGKPLEFECEFDCNSVTTKDLLFGTPKKGE